jgi:hypothetical protein
MPISLKVKKLLKGIFSESQLDVLRRIVYFPKRSMHRVVRALPIGLYSSIHRKNLSKLAVAFGTDKEGGHHYAKHYQHHFTKLRRYRLNLLEIGIGGYDDPRLGGNSLRMWKAYFRKGNIFGLDIYDKASHDERRIKTFVGSQADEESLRIIAAEIGAIDIVIDDGSHINSHVTTAFKVLFPLLSPNGIYVIEDLQTSYWDDDNWDGSSDLAAAHTSMNFLKSLVDGLNYEEYMRDEYTPTYFDKNIISIHFYHNMAVLYKGANIEGSNTIESRFA